VKYSLLHGFRSGLGRVKTFSYCCFNWRNGRLILEELKELRAASSLNENSVVKIHHNVAFEPKSVVSHIRSDFSFSLEGEKVHS